MKQSILILMAIILAGTASAQCNATISPTSFTAISTNTLMDSAGAHSSGNDLLICSGVTLTYDYIYQYKTFYVSNGATLVLKKIQQCDVHLEAGATLQLDTVGSSFIAPMISNISFDSTNVNLIDTNQFNGGATNWVHCFGNTFDLSMFTAAPCGMVMATSENSVLAQEVSFTNPVHDAIQLHTNGKVQLAQLTIMDISGKTIRSVEGTSTQVDVAFLPQGIYLLQLTAIDGSSIVKKFYKD